MLEEESLSQLLEQKAICDLEIEVEKYLITHFENVILPKIRDKILQSLVVKCSSGLQDNSFEVSLKITPKF